MIRIFSFIGSMAGEKSATARFSDNLAAAVSAQAAKHGEEVAYERITGNQVRIDYCLSCSSCFKKGQCPLDSKDDMPLLKQKMKDCDILFFGSPVYIADMSGISKSVLDRCAYWTHRYELAGKPMAVFTTTDSSFGQETADRIADLLNYTGALKVFTGHAKRGAGLYPNLYLENDMKPVFEEAAQELLKAVNSPASFVTELDELKFQSRKKLASKALKITGILGTEPWNEVRVIEERGIPEAESFAAYVGDK